LRKLLEINKVRRKTQKKEGEETSENPKEKP
jgi:hypothetical protein